MKNSDQKILVVDDEPSTLTLFKNYMDISKQSYEVFLAGNVQEAVEILARENISFVISDISMPVFSGFDLLAILRARYPHIKVMLMTGYNSPEIRDEIKQSGCHFFEKPVRLDEVSRLIADELSLKNRGGFKGTLKNIQLADLIQMCCLSMSSMTICVRNGLESGTIFIEDGDIIHAVSDRKQGEKAFYEIMGWRSGSFDTSGDISASERSIHKKWEYLLMEGASRLDEKTWEESGTEKKSSERQKTASLNFCTPDENQDDQQKKLRVLIVDDSSIMCRILSDILSGDKNISIVGTAKNGREALEKVELLKPDVVTLDVNMPVMDGCTALKHIMIKKPCPVVIIGAIEANAAAVDFLRFGAVDFIRKPVRGKDMAEQESELVRRVRLASEAKVHNFRIAKMPKIVMKNSEPEIRNPKSGFPGSLVIISSGAGGYPELIRMIPRLPEDINACIIVLQNMPDMLVPMLADSFDHSSRLDILPLENKAPIAAGRCYICSGESLSSLKLETDRVSQLPIFHLEPGKKTVTFDDFLCSAGDFFSGRILVVLLSGAETGTYEGLEHIRGKNGKIIGQKHDSCMISKPLEIAKSRGLITSETDIGEMIRHISGKWEVRNEKWENEKWGSGK